MSEKTAAYIYKATILPIFDYNDVIYHLLTSQQQIKLQRIQNRALRIVFMGQTLSVHTRAKVDYLEQRQEQHLLSLMFKRSVIPEYVETITRATRQKQRDSTTLRVPNPKSSKLMKSPKYKGSKLEQSPDQNKINRFICGL